MKISSQKQREAIQGYLYLLPSFAILLVFFVIPIFMSIFFSFTEYNVIQPFRWIGLDNYKRLFHDIYVSASLKNTLFYTFLTVPLQTLFSLVLAAIIANWFRGRFGMFVKSALFVPVISSAILVGTLWSLLLATDGGAINNLLGLFGISPINWVGSMQTSLLSICLVAVWKNIGYFLVIFYAGIMDISPSLYEAAEVDGATPVQKFFQITLPILKPITYLVVTLGVIWSFQAFDLVYTMTGGGPGVSSMTLVLTIYSAAFKEYNMGYASAIAFVMLLVIIGINFLKKFLFREEEQA